MDYGKRDTGRESNPHLPVLLVAVTFLAAVALDYVTGTELRTYPLYFVPLLLAARYFSRSAAMIAAVAVTAAWAITHYYGGHVYSSTWIWVFNSLIQGAVFLLLTWLFSRLRTSLHVERELSRTDPLTGLPNSRSFFERAGSVLAVCHRNNQPVTLAYIDLDNFKQANDSLGHRTGDAVLRKVADVLNSNLRASDIAARLGGDEFVLLLPEATEEKATFTLEKIRRHLANCQELLDSRVTASIGAVSCASAPHDITSLVHAADKLMYRVKATSKNKVLVQGVSPA